MSDLSRQIVVRVSPDMLDSLKDDADRNGRTVAQSVRFLLTGALDNRTRETP